MLKDPIAVLAALVRGSVEAVKEYLASPAAHVDGFRAFMRHHQLLGYTDAVLRDHPLREALPASFVDDLEVHAQKLARKNQRVRETLPRVAEALAQADVPFLLLKGLHHALKYYGGMDRRTFWDMDVLVRPGDLFRAQQQLEALGYARTSPLFINARVSQYFTHAYDFRKPHALDIDLHWKLVNHPGLQLNYTAIWQTKQPLALDATTFDTLSDSYALTFLLVGIVKDIERGALRLRSLVDLYHMLQALDEDMAWPSFFEEREAEGIRPLCLAALALFWSVFEVPRGTFPRVKAALEQGHAVFPAREDALALLRPGRYALKNKRWAADLYATSRAGYAWWWAYSLPARWVVHKPTRKKKKKKPIAV